jgi:hypothetical protein
MEETSEHPVDS